MEKFGKLSLNYPCYPLFSGSLEQALSAQSDLDRYPVCVCIPILVTTFPSGSAVRNQCRTHPGPCVRPRCVCSALRAHAQFYRFDKADATADIQ